MPRRLRHSVTASSNAATKSFETRGSNMQCSSITRCQDSSHGSSCLTQFCPPDSECLFLFLWKFSQLQKGMTNATTRFNFDKEHNERHMRWPATATGAPVSALKKKHRPSTTTPLPAFFITNLKQLFRTSVGCVFFISCCIV